MRKWSLLFLLLLNVVVLFWFSMQRQGDTRVTSPARQLSAAELKLVSEVSDTQLLERGRLNQCYLYGGINARKDWQEISAFMQEYQVAPLLRQSLDVGPAAGMVNVLFFHASVDERMLKKVHQVLQDSYPELKIEKKSCAGLASSYKGQ